MAFAQNSTPTLVKQPRTWIASIGNGDASAWKLLLDGSALGSGPNGSKIVSIYAASTDSGAKTVQLAKARSFSGVAISNASPAVVTWSAANGNNLAVGDQVMFQTTGTLPTGISPNTTYFVISAGFSAGVSFEISATAGGSAINTSGAGSGTHTIFAMKPINAQSVAITAGTDGTTAPQDMLALAGGLPLDQDAQKYVFMESVDYLAVSCTGTVTANKMITVTAEGGDF